MGTGDLYGRGRLARAHSSGATLGPVHSPDLFFPSFISSFIIFRSSRLIRVW